ncbi:pyridoxal-dependent decarboxylase [Aspergillus crustosus]
MLGRHILRLILGPTRATTYTSSLSETITRCFLAGICVLVRGQCYRFYKRLNMVQCKAEFDLAYFNSLFLPRDTSLISQLSTNRTVLSWDCAVAQATAYHIRVMASLPATRIITNPCKTTRIQKPDHRKLPPKELVDLAIENHIARLARRLPIEETGSFFVADLGQVARQQARWVQNLPNVQPYYAVKCNPDPTLLTWLATLGTGFDCASSEEIRSVLSLNVDPGRIIFANPCKSPAALVFTRKAGVTRMTFDNLDELEKIRTYVPEAQLLLRIHACDESALVSLGEKFGARLDTTRQLLSRAWALGLSVVGVSFHVGTGAKDPEAFRQAIKDAALAFRHAADIGFGFTTLDIGGGFQDTNFEAMARIIRETISAEFPRGITVIAEPGRYYARSAYTLVSQVIGRRRQIGIENESAGASKVPDMLYQNDGVYGNFMNVVMEKEVVVPQLCFSMREKAEYMKRGRDEIAQGPHGSTEYHYSIWGPTCDSIDCVVREARFNSEVNIGDWLKYYNMGAYTSATATRFNGFCGNSHVLYVNSELVSRY